MIKKILGIALMFVLLVCGSAFACNLDTAEKAFSTNGCVEVAMGEAPWQHKLLWPLSDNMVVEIQKYLTENGEVGFIQSWGMLYARMAIDDAVIVRLARVDVYADTIMYEELVFTDGNILISSGVYGSLSVATGCKYPIIVVIKINEESRSTMLYVETPDITPNIYASMWRKFMFNFYVKYVNPNWHNELGAGIAH